MLVVLLVAAAVIGVGMIVVAVGRGGEMAEFSADVRPVDADIQTAADVALLRPPGALWGYDKRSTDEALNLVARTVTERDVEIATLRRQIADLQSAREPGAAGEPGQAREPGAAAHAGPIWELGQAQAGELGAATQPGVTWDPVRGWEPGAAAQPGQAGPGSPASALLRRQASPAPPPAEKQSWSAWDPFGPASPPDQNEPAEPGETG